jgi:hypothetical protein
MYWRGDIRQELDKFCEEHPSADQDAIGKISFIFAPIWSRSTYFIIEGTDNDLEKRLSTLWKQTPSYKLLKIAGVTALQVNAASLASIEPLLSGLNIAHKGRTAEAALLAVLPLVK